MFNITIMPELVTIESVTANTPVEIYYCDATSGSCVYVATVSVFPYEFEVPEPYSTDNIIIKIIDTQSFEYGKEIPISPTPTNTMTPTPSVTASVTPTPSITPTITPTITVSTTLTPTPTPTITPTISTTPTIFYHPVGQNTYDTSVDAACADQMTILNYYTYLSDGPIALGIVIYTVEFNGFLYNPLFGEDKYIKMQWGNNLYEVQTNNLGEITDYVLC